MLDALKNVFKVKELRNKVLFVLGVMVVYRLGVHIPVPGVDVEILEQQLFGGAAGEVFGFIDLFAGGALERFSVFALGITPYITASIILQLLTAVIPRLEELSRQGREGRKKIAQYTRYGTVVLALIQGIGITMYVRPALHSQTLYSLIVVVITLVAGTSFLMWLGEQVNEYGIGNGISILIFTSIIARFPMEFGQMFSRFRTGEIGVFNVGSFLVLAILIIAGVIFVQQGERKIPVQYSKRVVGRKVYGGRSTHIPMRVNQAGVIPVIFASSVLMFPPMVGRLLGEALSIGWLERFGDVFLRGSPIYLVTYALFIMFFTYFYTAITFNPEEVADNMKKRGGFIPGIRPGKATVNYLDRILVRVTLVGAIFLTVVSLIPFAIPSVTGVQIQWGGTSLLIMTGVALRTMQQIESHLLMRHYEGFME